VCSSDLWIATLPLVARNDSEGFGVGLMRVDKSFYGAGGVWSGSLVVHKCNLLCHCCTILRP
jgi:hypothetical protein